MLPLLWNHQIILHQYARSWNVMILAHQFCHMWYKHDLLHQNLSKVLKCTWCNVGVCYVCCVCVCACVCVCICCLCIVSSTGLRHIHCMLLYQWDYRLVVTMLLALYCALSPPVTYCIIYTIHTLIMALTICWTSMIEILSEPHELIVWLIYHIPSFFLRGKFFTNQLLFVKKLPSKS